MKIFRQGDVLLVEADLPKEAIEDKDTVLARGEVTGHKHQILGTVQMFRNNNQRFAQVQEAKLVHEEHKEIEIPKGTYEVRIQREYNPMENRQVSD